MSKTSLPTYLSPILLSRKHRQVPLLGQSGRSSVKLVLPESAGATLLSSNKVVTMIEAARVARLHGLHRDTPLDGAPIVAAAQLRVFLPPMVWDDSLPFSEWHLSSGALGISW